jgi:DNA-binding LytR/AlgR family response regulator
MNVRCIIVDDEPLARDVIENYVSRIASLQIMHSCKSAYEAISFLQTHQVDLIFLDIEMPGLNGLQMLDTLTYKPQIILTTAYSKYAVKSYEYTVTDYLVKPISFERFLKAVNKVQLNRDTRNSVSSDSMSFSDGFIFLKADKESHRVPFSDIEYIEAYGNYLKVHLSKRMILVYETMSSIENRLPVEFLRVHKSFIIPLPKISKISGNRIFINEAEIPVGKFYKKSLLDYLNA